MLGWSHIRQYLQYSPLKVHAAGRLMLFHCPEAALLPAASLALIILCAMRLATTPAWRRGWCTLVVLGLAALSLGAAFIAVAPITIPKALPCHS